MFSRTLIVMLLASAAAAKEGKVKADDLPQATKVEKMVKLTPFSRVLFELDGQGRLFFNGSRITLNEFDKTVLRYTEQRGIHLRRTPGKKGYEEINPDLKGSPVHVILRVHKEAPWRHVQWMLMILQEQRAIKAEFLARDRAGREGIVKAWLPLGKEAKDQFEISADDEDIDEATKAPPKQPGTVHVTLLPEGSRRVNYGGMQVAAPEAVSWAVGRKKIAEFKELKSAIAAGHSAARQRTKTPRTEIRAAGRVPHGEVVRVLDLVLRARHKHIDFGTQIPSAKERMANPLPYPK